MKLYFFPTQYKFEWDSPQILAKSVIRNNFLPSKYKYRASIGHVSVELKCGEYFYDHTGMTTLDKNEDTDLVLKKKIGLGVMFYPMAGKLQTISEITKDIKERMGGEDISWVKYKINEFTCFRLKEYLTIYRQENLEQVYGLVFNPRRKEGAGCSAFAMSFLEIAGILTDEHRLNWSRHLNTNKDLNAYNGSSKSVSIFKMALGINSKTWAKSPSDGIPISFWEPNLMHEWTKRTFDLENQRHVGIYELESYGKSKGIVYDARLKIPDLGPLFY